MNIKQHNPNFGSIYCPYVVFRPYDGTRQHPVKKTQFKQITGPKKDKFPALSKNGSQILSKKGDTEIHRLNLTKNRVDKKGVKYTLGIR